MPLVAGLLLGLSVLGCGPGKAPPGQTSMVVFGDRTIDEIRQKFNESSAGTRAILLLSPT